MHQNSITASTSDHHRRMFDRLEGVQLAPDDDDRAAFAIVTTGVIPDDATVGALFLAHLRAVDGFAGGTFDEFLRLDEPSPRGAWCQRDAATDDLVARLVAQLARRGA